MLRRMPLALLALWAGLLLISPAAGAEPVFPPGLRIGLTPPDGMTLSKRFVGFEDFSRKVAIGILDLPIRAYQDIERSAFAKDQQNVTQLKRESFPFASGIGILVSGIGNEKGATVHKWFLLATAVGGPAHNLAMMVRVEVPEAATAVYSDAVIRKALASITFRPTPVQERLGLLPFKLDNLAGFRVLQVSPTGSVVLTDGPGDDIGQQPYMIVSIGPGSPPNADERARFANDMLSSAPIRNFRVQVSERMRITGAAGHEIRAQGEGLRGEPIAMVQWVRFGGSGFLRIVGVTPAEQWDELFTRFRAVRDGIDFR
ncbi:MAG: hypothetical protein K9G60_12450 [Pseudolabrys sp.]|nr:hypothetical protein [Pseudolabrys sp.]